MAPRVQSDCRLPHRVCDRGTLPPPDPTDAERERTLALAAELKRRNARLAELERDYEQLARTRETVRERNQYREQLRKARYENTWLRDQLRNFGHYKTAATPLRSRRAKSRPRTSKNCGSG